MEQNKINELLEKWVSKEDLTNAKWTVNVEKDSPNSVNVSGTIDIIINGEKHSETVNSIVEDKPDSIGQALQSLNQALLQKINKLISDWENDL